MRSSEEILEKVRELKARAFYEKDKWDFDPRNKSYTNYHNDEIDRLHVFLCEFEDWILGELPDGD